MRDVHGADEPRGGFGPEHETLLARAAAFHGHLCPGQILGVRMSVSGCHALGLDVPRPADKRLVVFVEIDRCATDAIEILTGTSLGKGTLRHVDHGKSAAAFVDAPTGRAVRVAVRDEARERAAVYAPGVADPREAQMVAYRVMPDAELLRIEAVRVDPARLRRPRTRVRCATCGEGVTYGRAVRSRGGPRCRACAGDRYYVRLEAEV